MESRKKFFILDDQTAKLARLAANAINSEELAKLCQRMYIADYINLENIDLWLAKHALTAVYRVLQQYPALRREMHYFGTLKGFVNRKDDLFAFLYPDSDEYIRKEIKRATDQTAAETKKSFKNGGLAVAFFTACGDFRFCGIIIDEEDFDETEIIKNLRYGEEVGHSPHGCGTVKGVVDHELGHLLDYWLGISSSQEFLTKIQTVNSQFIAANLSTYCVMGGRVDYCEVVAEGFAEYRNSSQPRGIARFVGYLVEKRYKQKLKEIEIQGRDPTLYWGK